jgi:hypothetical protein
MPQHVLPAHLEARVLSMPESSYGLTRVTVILDDGTRVANVQVAWGREIFRVGDTAHLDFDPSRIVDAQSEV